MAILFAILAMVLVLCGAYGIRMVRSGYTFEDLPEQSESSADTDVNSGRFARLLDLLGLRFQRVLRRMYGPVRLRALDVRIRNAGNPEGLTLDLFIQRQAGFIVLSCTVLLFCILGGPTVLGILVAVTFSGWMHLWLRVSARQRRAEIERELPDFLDILAVTVQSGLAFRAALERVSNHFHGAISEEMRRVLNDMRLGTSRREAFVGLRERCGAENVTTFVGALLQSEELGTPIADVLASIAKEIRRERAQQVRRDAVKAQPKVTLVATLTMLPGALILLAGGIIFAHRDLLAELIGGG